MYGSSFNDRHLVAKDSLKLNNTVNTSLIRLNIILHYSLPLNTCDCLMQYVRCINRIVIDWKIIHISI